MDSRRPRSRREMLRTMAATGTLVAGASLAGCTDGGNGGGDGGGSKTVEMIDDLAFDPDSITVSTGTTVVWENVGSVGHSVTAFENKIPSEAEYFASGGFDSEQAARNNYSAGDPDSGDIGGGETYEHDFETAGAYEYFCIPHESAGMKGTVEVSE